MGDFSIITPLARVNECSNGVDESSLSAISERDGQLRTVPPEIPRLCLIQPIRSAANPMETYADSLGYGLGGVGILFVLSPRL